MSNFRRVILLFLLSVNFLHGAPVVDGRRIMIVFVHGTVIPYFSPRATLSWCKNLFRRKKKKRLSSYSEQLKKFGVYRYQPVDSLGLHAIDPEQSVNKNDFKFFGVHTARLLKKMYDAANPEHKDTLLFYSYNWKGSLCLKERERAGALLYDAFAQERKKNNADTIYAFGHSHGMNVILNAVKKYQESREKLTIGAVFFGGPVQCETEHLISSPMFKNGVVHICSDGDKIQMMDFISSRDRMPRRIFGVGKKHNATLPKNFCQIKVKVGSYKPLHRELYMWGSKGYFSFLYRNWFPTFPLPVLVFTPAILALVKEIDATKDEKHLCSLSIDKKNQEITLSCGNDQKITRKYPISEIVNEGYSTL